MAWLSGPACALGNPNGETVYQNLCAECHGAMGQGGDGYPTALAGGLSVEELTALISDTMPEGDPQACQGEQASAVAAYVFDAFYSPKAQQQREPPRIKLSHLTARQYEQTLMDLLSRGGQGKRDDRRGLTAEFFTGQGADPNQRVRDEIVSRVDFHLVDSGFFDRAQLFPEKPATEDPMGRARAQSAFMKWTGGVIAPETGDYEFIVHCDAGFQLWVNGEEPLIDRAVQSGEEHGGSARIRLLEGHAYNLRLEATRVFEPDVQVRLSWKPPGGVEQLIPARVLTPHPQPVRYVTARSLPPDDRSEGFLQGASISALWDESTTQIALLSADWALKHVAALKDSNKAAEQQRNEAREFCTQVAERAFRRKLSEQEAGRVVDRYFDASPDDWRWAVKASLLRSLNAPQFLYPELSVAEADADARAAARLALTLWDSLPDDPLRLAAQKKDLHTHADVARQANWMLKDPRAAGKVMDFFHAWLHIKGVDQLDRDPQAFPGFSPKLAADMRTSLEMTLEEIFWSEQSDFRELFRVTDIYVNNELSEFLEVERPGSEGFVRRGFNSQRAGVITHPFVLASHAYYRESSPIHRGVFLAKDILGRTLVPPPQAVAPVAPESQPGLTTRERVALQTSPPACQRCHVLINGLGFCLENFDAAGRFRQQEQGKPIDSTGSFTTDSGERVDIQDACNLAAALADTQEVQRAFVVRLFEHFCNQPIAAYGEDTADRLVNYFRENNYNMRALLAEIATTAALKE